MHNRHPLIFNHESRPWKRIAQANFMFFQLQIVWLAKINRINRELKKMTKSYEFFGY